ncbi:hypothetical protein N7532_000140 [Penicillium argentinense]|uniref:Uncharacterized protein n=1 Tax=Penicillium argentinense TaxID=1131581 RepID=A0A9W9KMZ5_9EURO|nr:uncharacterized protein N7532_000140 [Penicillium argentinense]KAJ5112095.1 hypothetical protein N7532_000140 [Penicillium argentinense]
MRRSAYQVPSPAPVAGSVHDDKRCITAQPARCSQRLAPSAVPQLGSPPGHTGRLGTRAIVAPVAWEMMDVSDPRTTTATRRFRLPIGGPRDAVLADRALTLPLSLSPAGAIGLVPVWGLFRWG